MGGRRPHTKQAAVERPTKCLQRFGERAPRLQSDVVTRRPRDAAAGLCDVTRPTEGAIAEQESDGNNKLISCCRESRVARMKEGRINGKRLRAQKST